MLLIFALSLLSPGLSHSIQLLLHVLATVGSMRGGAPRPNLVAMAVVNRSGSSSPAEGGGEGIAVVAVFERESVYSNEVVCVCVCVCVCSCLVQKELTMFHARARADMVPHGGDLDIASTVGAFYRGQKARFHCHSIFSRLRSLKGLGQTARGFQSFAQVVKNCGGWKGSK
jgi:hypothetical protein